MFSRRSFLVNALKSCAGVAICGARRDDPDSAQPITFRLSRNLPMSLPADFIGLGYEMSSVAIPGLLTIDNHRYVNLIKGLGASGVLRVGGIVADYPRYSPAGPSKSDRQNTVIARSDLERFAGFLRETSWRAIWSLNFAQGTVHDAITEARVVARILGDRLLAIELGNEVENYGAGRNPFRHPPYNYETYRHEFEAWHAAIRAAVPRIRFAAPDTASSIEWVERVAADAKGEVQLLTTHYYRGSQHEGTVDQLLHPDPRLKDVLVRLRAASTRSGIPWRMCETNSFFGGGRPGVSDTFVAALWTLDYMLLLAEYGCSGVNIETGVNQLGFVSSYSPIQDNQNGLNTAGAPYYGMIAFATAALGCNQLLPIRLDVSAINITAYALGRDGKPRSLVIVNKDQSRDAHFSAGELGFQRASALRLQAPAPDSKAGITFAGSAVDPDGHWKAKTSEQIRYEAISVPRMSALVLKI